MKKIRDFVKNLIIIAYILVIIFVTICLLSYNDYGVAVLDGNTLFPVIDSDLEPNYTVGDLLIVKKNKLVDVKVGDKVFFYRTIAGEVMVNIATITDIEGVTLDEYTYTIEGNYKFSSSNFIGKVDTAKVIPKVGKILSILQSKWGFLFLGVFPSLIAFLYTLYTVVLEVQVPEEEETKIKKKSNKKKSVDNKKSSKNNLKNKLEENINLEKNKINEEKNSSQDKEKEIQDKEIKIDASKIQEEIKKTENKYNESKKESKDEKEDNEEKASKTKEIDNEFLKDEIKSTQNKISETSNLNNVSNTKQAQTAEEKKKALIEAKMKSMTEEEKKALIKAKLASMTEEEKRALIEAKRKKMEAQKKEN